MIFHQRKQKITPTNTLKMKEPLDPNSSKTFTKHLWLLWKNQ
jgi:hypothetical protein